MIMEKLLPLVFTLGLLFQIGACLQVQNPQETGSQAFTYVINEGDNQILYCMALLDSANGESVGTQVIKWHKTQTEAEQDEPELGTEVTSLGAVHTSFADTGRVSAEFTYVDASSYSVDLKLTGVTREDSGWYNCYAKDNNNQVYSIRYHVQVFANPTELMLSGKPDPEYNMTSTSGTLLFKANSDQGILECTAVQGYPSPTLRIYIDGETSQLGGFGQPTTNCELMGPIPGLQTMSCNTTLSVTNLQIRADQNGKKVFCEASPPPQSGGQGQNQGSPMSTHKVLKVLYKPNIINCQDDWKANVDDTDVRFGCTFEANPAPNVLWTSIESPKVLVYPDGKIVDSVFSANVLLTTMKTPGNVSIFQTDFIFVRVTENQYHKYELVVSNELGEDRREFRLDAGDVPEIKPGGSTVGAASQLTTSAVLVSLVAAFVALIIRQ